LYGKPCRHAQAHTNHKPNPKNTESSSFGAQSDCALGSSKKRLPSRKIN